MALDDLIRKGVALANSQTASLQVTVLHSHWDGVSLDAYGNPAMGAPVARKALYERKQKLIRTLAGDEVMSQGYMAFLEPVTIHPNDVLMPPDGRTGPILNMSGFVDAGTGQPFLQEVWLG